MDKNNLILVGKIVAAHGIRGEVKIQSYLENPADIGNYSPLMNEKGEEKYKIKVRTTNEDVIIAGIEGISDRNQSELLKGKGVYAHRDKLPVVEEEEFYYQDLVGLKALVDDNQEYGVITALYNYGAGDIIEIKQKDNGRIELFSFTKEAVPVVNIEEGYIVLDLPQTS